MDEIAYEHLVNRLEGTSRADPEAFRWRVALISSFAYVVLALTLIGLALVVYWLYSMASSEHRGGAMFRVGLFALTLLPLFWVTLRAFLMRIPPPEGRRLSRAEAPRVFELLEKIQKKLKGPPIHEVLLDERYNAAICQVPRLGLFGWHRNYLIIGLPYLLGTPTREVVATLAHEYGHLAGEHGKMGAWIYRQRNTFGAIHEKLAESAEDNWLNGLLAAALDRFAPYYNAYTFVLSRQQEYEADAAASRIAGEAVNASGLVRDTLLGRWVEEVFWRRFYDQADDSKTPRFLPFAAMRTAFVASYDDWAKQENLRAEMRVDSGLHDTHPCLRERLEAMDCKATLPPAIEHSAAESLLEGSAKPLIDEFDKAWWARHQADWQRHYEQRSADLKRFAELSALDLAGLPTTESFELARLAYRFGKLDTALLAIDRVMGSRDVAQGKAGLLKGKILLRAKDHKGLAVLEQAMQDDPNLVDDCLRVGYDFLLAQLDKRAAEAWVQTASEKLPEAA